MTQAKEHSDIVVLGLGNLLLTDDGVGVHAARALEKVVPRGVRVIDAGTAVLDTLPYLESVDHVIAIDAMKGGGKPGSIYLMNARDAREQRSPISAHSLGLRDAMRMYTGRYMSADIIVLGVEPESIEYGTDLSPTVQKALSEVVRIATNIAGDWLAECPRTEQEPAIFKAITN